MVNEKQARKLPGHSKRSYSLTSVILVVIAFFVAVSMLLSTTIIYHQQADAATTTLNIRSTKQEFQLPANYSTASLFEESQFVYVNTTYKYRYSPKLLLDSSQRAASASFQKGLPNMAFGVCANSKKPVRRQSIRKSWAKMAS